MIDKDALAILEDNSIPDTDELVGLLDDECDEHHYMERDYLNEPRGSEKVKARRFHR